MEIMLIFTDRWSYQPYTILYLLVRGSWCMEKTNDVNPPFNACWMLRKRSAPNWGWRPRTKRSPACTCKSRRSASSALMERIIESSRKIMKNITRSRSQTHPLFGRWVPCDEIGQLRGPRKNPCGTPSTSHLHFGWCPKWVPPVIILFRWGFSRLLRLNHPLLPTPMTMETSFNGLMNCLMRGNPRGWICGYHSKRFQWRTNSQLLNFTSNLRNLKSKS